MTFELEVPLRHHTVWPAFTDPEQTARAVPGLTVDAVHPVPPAEGSDGVAGDVVAGRLKLRVGAGPGGATITYRGTGCIASADAQKGTLDIAVDAAQARGNGALAGYLRVTLAPAGDAGERTLVSVVPELELSGRALEFAREDWHAAVVALATAWVEALTEGLAQESADAADAADAVNTADTADAADTADTQTPTAAPGPEAAPEADSETASSPEAASETSSSPEVASETASASKAVDSPESSESPESPEAPEAPEPAAPTTPGDQPPTAPGPVPSNVADRPDKSPESASAPIAEITETAADSLSEDPLALVWQGRYEKNRWLPLIAALSLFLLIKRRRRQRADKAGADSSFRME